MTRYIDAWKLIEYANNQKDKTVDANDIARFPTADVVPVKRGSWMHDSTGANYCSECNAYPYDDGKYHMVWHTNFCPNCGAKMDLKGEKE